MRYCVSSHGMCEMKKCFPHRMCEMRNRCTTLECEIRKVFPHCELDDNITQAPFSLSHRIQKMQT